MQAVSGKAFNKLSSGSDYFFYGYIHAINLSSVAGTHPVNKQVMIIRPACTR